jgi:hypothetical protein
MEAVVTKTSSRASTIFLAKPPPTPAATTGTLLPARPRERESADRTMCGTWVEVVRMSLFSRASRSARHPRASITVDGNQLGGVFGEIARTRDDHGDGLAPWRTQSRFDGP